MIFIFNAVVIVVRNLMTFTTVDNDNNEPLIGTILCMYMYNTIARAISKSKYIMEEC